MDKLDNEELFKSLYEASIVWCKVVNGGQVPNKKLWRLSNGHIEALLWNNQAIPKTGLSFLAREGIYRVGLNIYVHNPMIPDGSFAVLLAQQDEVNFIGGVLELFPTVSIEEDIAGFRAALNKIAQKHKMDSDHLRQGLEGAFTVGEEGSNLGAVAGFNLYRAGLEVNTDNLNFAQEAFMRALEEYQAIIDQRRDEVMGSFKAKEHAWQKHLHFMKEKDLGIRMALEQGLPMDFFEYSTFPPKQWWLYDYGVGRFGEQGNKRSYELKEKDDNPMKGPKIGKDKVLKEKTKIFQKDKREILKFVPKLRKVKKGSRWMYWDTQKDGSSGELVTTTVRFKVNVN